jgi:hypothetical protein
MPVSIPDWERGTVSMDALLLHKDRAQALEAFLSKITIVVEGISTWQPISFRPKEALEVAFRANSSSCMRVLMGPRYRHWFRPLSPEWTALTDGIVLQNSGAVEAFMESIQGHLSFMTPREAVPFLELARVNRQHRSFCAILRAFAADLRSRDNFAMTLRHALMDMLRIGEYRIAATVLKLQPLLFQDAGGKTTTYKDTEIFLCDLVYHKAPVEALAFMINTAKCSFVFESSKTSNLLAYACSDGTLSHVKAIACLQPNIVNQKSERGQSALATAVEWGNVDAMRFLIEEAGAEEFGTHASTLTKNPDLCTGTLMDYADVVTSHFHKCNVYSYLIAVRGHKPTHRAIRHIAMRNAVGLLWASLDRGLITPSDFEKPGEKSVIAASDTSTYDQFHRSDVMCRTRWLLRMTNVSLIRGLVDQGDVDSPLVRILFACESDVDTQEFVAYAFAQCPPEERHALFRRLSVHVPELGSEVPRAKAELDRMHTTRSFKDAPVILAILCNRTELAYRMASFGLSDVPNLEKLNTLATEAHTHQETSPLWIEALRQMTQPWAPCRTHHLTTGALSVLIQLHCVEDRRDRIETELPALPREIWHHIASFIRNVDYPEAPCSAPYRPLHAAHTDYRERKRGLIVSTMGIAWRDNMECF